MKLSVPATPHPTAVKLAVLVHERVAEMLQLLGAVHLHDKNTLKRILNLNDRNFRQRFLPALEAYVHGVRTQVEAAAAAALAVQKQAAAKAALHGYGSAESNVAISDANAALASTDPKSAQAIVDIVQRKGRPAAWKIGAAGLGAYALYRALGKKRGSHGSRSFAAFGDAGLVSGPLLIGGAALLLPMLKGDKLPPPPPPPPGAGGGGDDPLQTGMKVVSDAKGAVAAAGTVSGIVTAVCAGGGCEGAAAAAAAAAVPVGIAAGVAAWTGLSIYGTKQLMDKFGTGPGLAIGLGTGMIGVPAVIGAAAVANKLAPLVGISGAEGAVVSSVSAGTMIRRDSGDTDSVFLTDSNGAKHHITNMDTVNALGGDVVRVTAANVDAMPNSFDISSGQQGLAIRAGDLLAPNTMVRRNSGDTSAIFITNADGSKSHITDMGFVDARGGPGAVLTLPQATIDAMANGPDVG